MQLRHLLPKEKVSLNTEILEEMCARLGFHKAEAAICAAMEDLAVLLQYAGKLLAARDLETLAVTARQIEGLAARIGMPALGRVASDVHGLCEGRDGPALAATVCRMRRVGEASLFAVWDREDLSI